MTAFTVFLISLAYSRLIEDFPSRGGGYIVASKLIGPKAGDAVFSLAPTQFHNMKLPVGFAAIIVLVVLNLRGVKESVVILVRVFLLFCCDTRHTYWGRLNSRY